MKRLASILLRSIIVAGIAALAWYLNRTGLLERTLQGIESFGNAGPAIFVLVYATTCIFFVPSIVFTFSGGVLFGFWRGAVLSLVGTGLGSVSAFLIGRYLARAVVEKSFAANREFARLARAAQSGGWKIVALARLSPIFPFSIGNYAFGITRIPALHYLGASLLGTIPSTSVYTYVGTLVGDIGALGVRGRDRTWQEWLFLIAGLAMTMLLAYYLRRFAQKALAEEGKEHCGDPE
jgi:uncharacterized membrane protein YdjX (TVP38/TMEM64 family)